jgi:hypothetical protein
MSRQTALVTGGYGIALASYTGTTKSELSFMQGDRIRFLGELQDGWGKVLYCCCRRLRFSRPLSVAAIDINKGSWQVVAAMLLYHISCNRCQPPLSPETRHLHLLTSP